MYNVHLPESLRGPGISDARQFSFATNDLAEILRVRPQLNQFTDKQMQDILNGKSTIDLLTWHHHENGITLQLVDRGIHARTGHSGGRAATGGRLRARR